MSAASSRTLPPPLPEPPPPSSMTPRTVAARSRGRQLGLILRRNAELILGILGALGITVAQAADGIAAVARWGRTQGLYPALAVLAIGIAAAGIRQLLSAVWGLSDRLDSLATRWDQQHSELRGEVQALRTLVDTGPHARIEL